MNRILIVALLALLADDCRTTSKRSQKPSEEERVFEISDALRVGNTFENFLRQEKNQA